LTDSGKPSLPLQLETRRLILRVPQPADVAPLHEAIVSSHPQLKQWMPWAKSQTPRKTQEFCARARLRQAAAEGLDVILQEKVSGEIIGAAGFPRLDWELPKFEIGYWCRSDRTGLGLISETTLALADYAFSTLQAVRVELYIDDQNEKSIAVAERLGFRHEGLLRNGSRDGDGELRDMRLYAAVSMQELLKPQPR
jgi:ribosomal-protein-serine acetyltransferase